MIKVCLFPRVFGRKVEASRPGRPGPDDDLRRRSENVLDLSEFPPVEPLGWEPREECPKSRESSWSRTRGEGEEEEEEEEEEEGGRRILGLSEGVGGGGVCFCFFWGVGVEVLRGRLGEG